MKTMKRKAGTGESRDYEREANRIASVGGGGKMGL
jgi:hypothetical protein